MSVLLREPKRKHWGNVAEVVPFPIHTEKATGVPVTEATWQTYTGRFNGDSVIVENVEDIWSLYTMGCFGKGSLSRGCSLLGRAKKDHPQFIKESQWRRHKQWQELASSKKETEGVSKSPEKTKEQNSNTSNCDKKIADGKSDVKSKEEVSSRQLNVTILDDAESENSDIVEVDNSGEVENSAKRKRDSDSPGQPHKRRNPAAEELRVRNPAAEEPKVRNPAAEEPKVRNPAAEEPKVGSPAAEEPKVRSPAAEELKVQNPAAEEPKVQNPAAEEPKVRSPAAEEPKVRSPAAEEPKVRNPAAEEPKVRNPAAEEPKVRNPAAEEPKVRNPGDEESKIQNPASEGPKTQNPPAEKPADQSNIEVVDLSSDEESLQDESGNVRAHEVSKTGCSSRNSGSESQDCEQTEVVVLAGGDSEDEDFVPNLKPRLEHEPVRLTQETLVLSLEEALFLSYGLGCLRILGLSGEELSLLEIWKLFQESQRSFVQRYVAYHYFRSKGWVVKSGLKYGGDFALYKEGPQRYHSSYVVVVQVVKEGTSARDPARDRRPMSWTQLMGLTRLLESVGKEVILCQVIWPDKLQERILPSPKAISSFRVQETLLRRWVPSQDREGEGTTAQKSQEGNLPGTSAESLCA